MLAQQGHLAEAEAEYRQALRHKPNLFQALWGLNSICVDNKGGRNGARGPSFKQTDMKLSYRFRFGHETVDAGLELYNIFNVANFSNPTADQRLSDFLVLTALSGGNGQPRAAQVTARFGF